MTARNGLSQTGPNCSRMISATGDSLAEAAGRSLTANVNTMRNTNPSPAEATTDPMIARGTLRTAFSVSSDMFAALTRCRSRRGRSPR